MPHAGHRHRGLTRAGDECLGVSTPMGCRGTYVLGKEHRLGPKRRRRPFFQWPRRSGILPAYNVSSHQRIGAPCARVMGGICDPQDAPVVGQGGLDIRSRCGGDEDSRRRSVDVPCCLVCTGEAREWCVLHSREGGAEPRALSGVSKDKGARLNEVRVTVRVGADSPARRKKPATHPTVHTLRLPSRARTSSAHCSYRP